MKKAICMFLILVMVLSMSPATALATESQEGDVILFTHARSEAELEAELEADVARYLSRMRTNNRTRVIQNGTRSTFIEGRPAGQLPGGERFVNGGGWWLSQSGGPTISVRVQLPAPWNMISVAANMGTRGTTGTYHNAPDRTNFWHLYNRVEMRTSYWTIEEEVAPGGWVVFQRGQTTQRWSSTGFARRA